MRLPTLLPLLGASLLLAQLSDNTFCDPTVWITVSAAPVTVMASAGIKGVLKTITRTHTPSTCPAGPWTRTVLTTTTAMAMPGAAGTTVRLA
jgi:hypothetical protein